MKGVILSVCLLPWGQRGGREGFRRTRGLWGEGSGPIRRSAFSAVCCLRLQDPYDPDSIPVRGGLWSCGMQ